MNNVIDQGATAQGRNGATGRREEWRNGTTAQWCNGKKRRMAQRHNGAMVQREEGKNGSTAQGRNGSTERREEWRNGSKVQRKEGRKGWNGRLFIIFGIDTKHVELFSKEKYTNLKTAALWEIFRNSVYGNFLKNLLLKSTN